ncbi:hypothetical protein Ddye_026581 [Dipteronia dyeriana]|uniref:Reverse transcriptase domain-containing protein n=1 Tax=Dipteronia dyeriana TaxID=168575 RepID=A0AAD9TML4_9ROSI|nr:hypothetical protein Ddye_026581 [Dipteronia dyeriana]
MNFFLHLIKIVLPWNKKKKHLRSSRLSVFINGSPEIYFHCSRGVRQGDTLSPFLLDIAEDFLSKLLSRMVDFSQLLPISSPRGFSAPTHLLYADDVLIFYRGTVRNLKNIMSAFEVYGNISGKLVNWGKSSIYFGSAVSPSQIGRLQSLVGMQIGRLPFSYLGVPLFRGKPKKSVLQPIADKILSKFANWKEKALSLAGRTTLIKLVITGSFVHSFMIYKCPSSLLRLVNRKLRNFLWTGYCEETKLIRVAWGRCCNPYSQCGIGLKDLGLLNDSLLKKLTLKFLTSKCFSFLFMRERYLTQLRKSHGGYVTSSIWPSFHSHYSDLLKEGIWLIGENSHRDFWHDNWLGVPILELLGIPDYLATLLKARVSDFIYEGKWVLDDSFRVHFPNLCSRIDSVAISLITDSLVWAHSQDGQVSCNLAYSCMIRDSSQVTWWRDVWCHFISLSRSALTWRLLLNRLPTEDHLCRAGFHLASRCSVCGVSSESSPLSGCSLGGGFLSFSATYFCRYVELVLLSSHVSFV